MKTKDSPIMYKNDSKGKLRVWSCRVEEVTEDTADSIVTSGLATGKLAVRTKPVKSSSVKKAFDRAVTLMDNAVIKKEREGYHLDKESARNAGVLFKPMKAQTFTVGETKVEPIFSVQPKINGCRAPYNKENDKLHSKSMLEFDIAYVHKELKQFAEIAGASVDGELYIEGLTAPEISGAARNKLNRHAGNFKYWLYDVMTDDGFEIREQDIKDAFIEYEILFGKPKYLIWTPTLRIHRLTDLKPMYDRFLEQGFEGLMIRLWGIGYEYGKRSSNLLKWKPVLDGEFEVIHVTYEQRKTQGVNAKTLFLVEFHCKCGGGMFKVIPAWDVETRHNWYLDHKDMPMDKLLACLLPLRVEFREWTKDNKPFHAVGIEFRDPRF